MLITYRKTGGLGALLALGAIALVAGVLTIAAAAVVLIVGAAGAGIVLLVRAVLPRSWRRRKVPPATQWPRETIEGTVVKPALPPRPVDPTE
jgi:hypothetical protein